MKLEDLKVNVADVLDMDEVECAIREGAKNAILREVQYTDLKTIVINRAYDIVYKMIDEKLNNQLEAILVAKIEEIMGKLDTWHMVHWGDTWSKPSKSAEIINKIFEDRKEILEKKVDEVIANMKPTKKVQKEIVELLLKRMKEGKCDKSTHDFFGV